MNEPTCQNCGKTLKEHNNDGIAVWCIFGATTSDQWTPPPTKPTSARDIAVRIMSHFGPSHFATDAAAQAQLQRISTIESLILAHTAEVVKETQSKLDVTLSNINNLMIALDNRETQLASARTVIEAANDVLKSDHTSNCDTRDITSEYPHCNCGLFERQDSIVTRLHNYLTKHP